MDYCSTEYPYGKLVFFSFTRSKDSLRFDIQICFGYKYAVRCHRHANNTE